jgi:hypothetical protein
VNGSALLVPAGVVTVTLCERRVADRAIRNVAVIVVELTTTALLTVTPLPFMLTVAGAVKLLPASVTVTVAPRAAAFGDRLLNIGAAEAGWTVNDCAPLVPALVETVTLWLPAVALAAMVKVAVIFVPSTTVTLLTETPVPLAVTDAPG